MKQRLSKEELAEIEKKFPPTIPYEEGKDPVLSIRHIDITFGAGRKIFKAVSDANFDIYKGETVSLVGESGSGKTTIGRAIVRINPCSAGAIYYKGARISGKIKANQNTIREIQKRLNEAEPELAKLQMKVVAARPRTRKIDPESPEGKAFEEAKAAFKAKQHEVNAIRRELSVARHPAKEVVRKIQMIFQDPAASLNERATIEYIISEGLINFKMFDTEEERIQKVENVIREVGLLPEHLTRYPHEFSGGQRQRVGIARSIVMEPEFIVADEPISALDVSIRAQVLNLLKKFQREQGLTYLFIAHDLSIVRYISDRIVVIHLGKIVEIAPTEELFAHPLHPYTKSLMSAIPIPDPILEKEKNLFVYDRSMHDYSVEQPSLVDIGNGHFVYGSPSEIARYREQREKE